VSNVVSVAATTATLQSTLQNALDRAAMLGLGVPNASVVTTRPSSVTPTGPGVHLYLYRLEPNAAWANSDLAFRDSSGRLAEIPTAAVTLHYLLTFFGDEDELEPQRLLGIVVAHLHSEPYLTKQMVTDTLQDINFQYVNGSDLAGQPELVRLTPVPLSLDDLSRIWTSLPSGGFGVSVAYQAAPVLLQPEVMTSQSLPVRSRGATVVPVRQPVVTSVEAFPPAVPPEPITVGTTVLVRGRNLSSSAMRVEIDGSPVAAAAVTDVADTSLQVALPGALPAGARALQVVHVLATSAAGTEQLASSNVGPFLLRPSTISANRVGTTVRAEVSPEVGAGQRVDVTLDPAGGGAAVTRRATVDVGPPARVVGDLTGVPAGTYRVRVRVDGADEVPALAGGVFTGPTVTVP